MQYPIFILLLALLFGGCRFTKRTAQVQNSHAIAFYNVENFFDTINDVDIYDDEFTPDGKKKWNTKRYLLKQHHIGQVIAEIGTDQGFNGPSIVGLCEIEKLSVLQDLIASAPLKNQNYSIIHFDSPDKRGIDVALLYKADRFNVVKTKLYPLVIHDTESGERVFTRDQLLVSGKLDGDLIHIIVNHWPSRYGGQERSIPSRRSAALLNRHIIDSLQHINKNAKIITMGDMNDDPTDESVRHYLAAHATKSNLNEGDLYNPLASIFKLKKGTLYYKGKWNLFDQLIISQGLLNSRKGYAYDSVYIFNKPYLIQQEGRYKGHLLRTYGGTEYLSGYSDHLPVYMVLSLVKD